MIRRGQKKRQQARKAQRKALDDLESEQGSYVPPDSSECVETEWTEPGKDSNTIEVRQRIWRYRGRVARFTITIHVLLADSWHEVERIDCSHGHCHLHQGNGAVSSLARLDDIGDVERAYDGIDAVLRDRMRILRGEEG